MNESLRAQIDRLLARHEEVGALLADSEILADQGRYRKLSQEYARLQELVDAFTAHRAAEQALRDAQAMRADPDPDVQALAQEEASHCEIKMGALENHIQRLLLPADPHDQSDVFLEVRAGTGGDEAALFAGDLLRMYTRYAEFRGWSVEIVDANPGEHGGFKEVIARIGGEGVYSRLKFESGVHRVQRIPSTESQGRIHTSACTVAILPEVEEIEEIDIDAGDVKVDTFRASGAGGQHVNKTDSAVRITHLPSGIVVECQAERSQHKNRARAMSLLRARLLDQQREQQSQTRSALRRSQVGSGDRSERIRTYNFPQGRVTDHRINLTLYQLEDIMNGALDDLLQGLQEAHEARLLAQLAS